MPHLLDSEFLQVFRKGLLSRGTNYQEYSIFSFSRLMGLSRLLVFSLTHVLFCKLHENSLNVLKGQGSCQRFEHRISADLYCESKKIFPKTCKGSRTSSLMASLSTTSLTNRIQTRNLLPLTTSMMSTTIVDVQECPNKLSRKE